MPESEFAKLSKVLMETSSKEERIQYRKTQEMITVVNILDRLVQNQEIQDSITIKDFLQQHQQFLDRD